MKKIVGTAIFMLCCCIQNGRAIVIDEQGLCWKATRWKCISDGSCTIFNNKGTVAFSRVHGFFVLNSKTSWWEAGKMLSVNEKDCTDFTYKNAEKEK